jgi:ketosteroid isomerase-like protein
MATDHLVQAELNKDVVQRHFDAAISGDRVTANALNADDYLSQLTYGHPDGGTFQGLAEVGSARARMISLLGITGIKLKEIIADGPVRVVALVDAEGTDESGEPWFMPCVELIQVVDGKIAEVRMFYQDTVRLLELARAREAAGLVEGHSGELMPRKPVKHE